jgi:hypothetical protein
MPLAKPISPVLQRGHPLAAGLVAAWPFHEGSGGTLNDLGPNQYTGTAINGRNWGGGDFGSAFQGVKASDRYVQTTLLNCGFASGTIFWLQARTNAFNSGVQNFFWGQDASGANELSGQIFSDNNWYVGWNNGGDTRVTLAASAANAPQNQWVAYAFTWTPSGSKLYQGGVGQIGSNGSAPTVGNLNTPMTIGRGGVAGAGGAAFDGSMGNFAVWNRALSANEIAQLAFDSFAIYRPRSRWWEVPVGAAPAAKKPSTLPMMGAGLLYGALRRNAVIRRRSLLTGGLCRR